MLSFLFLLSAGSLLAKSTDDLFAAITKGDLAGVNAAIAKGADVNATDANGNTPLLTAVWHPEIVKQLIAAKADVNKFSSSKAMNPMLSAANWGVPESIEMLAAAGADINARDPMGQTPLFYAAYMAASAPIMQLLIDKGADAKAVNNFNQNALMVLASQGRSAAKRVEQLNAIVPYLMKAGLSIPERLTTAKASDFSSIEDRIDVLLKAGIGIDDESQLMVPPTVPNAEKMNKNAKKLKLKQWPLYNALDNLWDKGAMVKALLAKGANPKKEFGSAVFNWNLLHTMCIKSALTPEPMEEAADALVKAGVDMNQKDLQGYTPLIKAAKEGNKGVASALVKNGADLNVAEKDVTSDSYFDGYGTTVTYTKTWRTARDWAAETKHNDIYDIIKNAGGKGASEVVK